MSARVLALRHALVLGLVQGPTELLPVSSSAHTALLPGLLGWNSAELDAPSRNALEVALHAGTAAALVTRVCSPPARASLVGELRELDGRRVVALALALVPPALVGALLERRLEHRPDAPRALAAGLLAGGAALALADTRPQRRTLADADPGDGLALGLAQALALAPGVSRSGATLTAARLRGFARADAQALSWRVGLPVLLGAAALKGVRGLFAGRSGSDTSGGRATAATSAANAVGAAGAFVSTLASAPLVRPGRCAAPLAPFALYRGALAWLVLRRAREPAI